MEKSDLSRSRTTCYFAEGIRSERSAGVPTVRWESETGD
jgi:hypothetical protein